MEVPNSIAHVPPVRSTRGCWTCRLRKKKCDEVFPGCLRCASVDVDCHYGPRPSWIDNTGLAKKELERIKRIVGASASRKRAAFRAKSSNASKSPSTENADFTFHDDSFVARSEKTPPPEPQVSSLERPTAIIAASPLQHQPKWVEDHESSLMMHYLDHVFFIQFRFYAPSIATGGRGWLLSLLTQTKPLYHAALSLSACLAQEGGEARTDYLQELERHHNLTLEELQLFIQAHSEHASTAFGGNVQILACMVQLISFELFHGGVRAWQVHLRAATELVLLLHNLSEIRGTNPSATIMQPVESPEISNQTINSMPLSPDSAALGFFTNAIIWFDILACISTGQPPYLSNHYDHLLRSPDQPENYKRNGVIELQTVMGCQNWAMVAIGEIAALSTWKQEKTRSGSLDIHHVAEVAKNIQLRLETEQSRICGEIDCIRDEYLGPPPYHRTIIYNAYTILVVTRIFACAALIYLQTVVSSDPSILNISAALQNVMTSMNLMPDPRMFRGLVWPICVAGCMASTRTHQQFFKDTIMDAIIDSPRFGNSGQAMQILEKSWEMQRERGRLIDCATVIQELGVCVLLV